MERKTGTSTSEDFSELLTKARLHYRKSEFKDAELALNEAVKISPEKCSKEQRLDAYIEMGEAFFMQGNFTEAESCYETSKVLVEDERMQGICILKLADAIFMQEPSTEAENHYEDAFDSFQNDMMCLCFIKLEKAVDIVERINMKGVCRLKLGDAFFMTEKHDESVKYYREAIGLFADCKMQGLCYIKLGDAFVMAQDFDNACEYYRNALELCKDSNIEGVCQLKLGDASFKRDKFADAEQYYQKAIESSKKTHEKDLERQCYIRLGAAFGQMGRFIEARDILLRALHIKPNYHHSPITYPINQKNPVGAPIIVIPTDNVEPKPTNPCYRDGEIDEDDGLIYSILAEVSYYLGAKEEEKQYRGILRNIDITLETIETAKRNKYLTGHIIKRYVVPCNGVQKTSKDKADYPMAHKVRGLCLILNNIDFEEHQKLRNHTCSSRKGSEIDEANMSNVFQQLNFHVIIENNLTAKRLQERVKFWVNNDETKSCDAFVLVIMSHGKDNKIFGTDRPIKQHTILLEVYSSKNLAGKPKVAIIQACKGDDFNKSEGSKQYSSEADADNPNDPVRSKCYNAHGISDSSGSDATANVNSDDCFIMNATMDGFMAHRIPGRGSPFIAALTQALFEHSHTKHIAEIFEEARMLMVGVAQKPSMHNFLKAPMYLSPECSTDPGKLTKSKAILEKN